MNTGSEITVYKPRRMKNMSKEFYQRTIDIHLALCINKDDPTDAEIDNT